MINLTNYCICLKTAYRKLANKNNIYTEKQMAASIKKW